jgi:hypothetical protein
MRQLHHGPQWHLPEMRHLRRHQRVFVVAIQSSLTGFGLCCRRFRAAAGYTLADQALAQRLSAAAIADIETGRSPIPGGFVASFVAWLSLDSDGVAALREAEKARSISSLPGLTPKQSRFLCRAFRGLRSDSPALIRRLASFLQKGLEHASR